MPQSLNPFGTGSKAAADIAALSAEQSELMTAFNDAGKTVSVLLVDDRPVGLLAIRDEPRPDAISALQTLKQAGIATVMLTGDNKRTAAAIAGQLGIEPGAELDRKSVV